MRNGLIPREICLDSSGDVWFRREGGLKFAPCTGPRAQQRITFSLFCFSQASTSLFCNELKSLKRPTQQNSGGSFNNIFPLWRRFLDAGLPQSAARLRGDERRVCVQTAKWMQTPSPRVLPACLGPLLIRITRPETDKNILIQPAYQLGVVQKPF